MENNKKDNFGLISASIGLVIYIIIIIIFVMPLPRKIDTLLVATLLCSPCVFGSLIYHKIASKDGWNSSKKLK